MKTRSSAQCTHPWPRLRTGRAHSAVSQRALGRVAARTGAVSWRALVPCRGHTQPCHRRVAVRSGRVTDRVARARCRVASPLSVTIQKLYRDPIPVARAPGRLAGRVAARYCRVAALYGNPVEPYYDTNGRPQPRYNFFVLRLTLGQAMCLPAELAPAHRPTVSWPLLAVSWGRVVATLLHAPTLCVMIQKLYRDSN